MTFEEVYAKYRLNERKFPLAQAGKSVLNIALIMTAIYAFFFLAFNVAKYIEPRIMQVSVIVSLLGWLCLATWAAYFVIYVLRSHRYWERRVLRNDFKNIGKHARFLKYFGYSTRLKEAGGAGSEDSKNKTKKDKELIKALDVIRKGELLLTTRQTLDGKVVNFHTLFLEYPKKKLVKDKLDALEKDIPEVLASTFHRQVNFSDKREVPNSYEVFYTGKSGNYPDPYNWQDEYVELWKHRRAYNLEHNFPYRKSEKYYGLFDPTDINAQRRVKAISWAEMQQEKIFDGLRLKQFAVQMPSVDVTSSSAVYDFTIPRDGQSKKIGKGTEAEVASQIEMELSDGDRPVVGVEVRISISSIKVTVPLPNGKRVGDEDNLEIEHIKPKNEDLTAMIDKEKIFREFIG